MFNIVDVKTVMINGKPVKVKVYESQAARFLKGWRERKEAAPMSPV